MEKCECAVTALLAVSELKSLADGVAIDPLAHSMERIQEETKTEAEKIGRSCDMPEEQVSHLAYRLAGTLWRLQVSRRGRLSNVDWETAAGEIEEDLRSSVLVALLGCSKGQT